MSDHISPGQIAYAAYVARLYGDAQFPWPTLLPDAHAAWEAAAQAVLEARASLCPICGSELARCNARPEVAAPPPSQRALDHPAQAALDASEETPMQWSHMTNAQARALRDLLRQLGVPVERQFWRQAQTHDNDHTCYVSSPTVREIEAIAQLMKTRTAEEPDHA